MKNPSAFEIYLRTGRLPLAAVAVEHKFNPWHDPEDGRFTFRGLGRYFGLAQGDRSSGNRNKRKPNASNAKPARPRPAEKETVRGRGGDFGGGGAGFRGDWDPPRSNPPKQRPAAPAARVVPQRQSRAAPRRKPVEKPKPPVISKNGYRYEFDSVKRPARVSGELQMQIAQLRSRNAQANAGKPDRRDSDDGGHYIAARFNGPTDWFNHFAQDSNFNRGAYRVLEDQWAKAIKSGKRVFVDIVPHYRDESKRPYEISVTWNIDGKPRRNRFRNEKGGQ